MTPHSASVERPTKEARQRHRWAQRGFYQLPCFRVGCGESEDGVVQVHMWKGHSARGALAANGMQMNRTWRFIMGVRGMQTQQQQEQLQDLIERSPRCHGTTAGRTYCTRFFIVSTKFAAIPWLFRSKLRRIGLVRHSQMTLGSLSHRNIQQLCMLQIYAVNRVCVLS